MQSYTANLSSILTVDQLRPSADIGCAGYQERSFVKDMLTEYLGINKLRGYSGIDQYAKALSLGCKNSGVDAIFDEISYIKLFLTKYDSKYKMAGTTFHSGGFGFVSTLLEFLYHILLSYFRDYRKLKLACTIIMNNVGISTGSPLSKPISKAILDVMENGQLRQIERNYFEVRRASQGDAEDASRKGPGPSPSLRTIDFAGLFLITACLALIALVCFEYSCIISKSRVHSIEMALAPESELQDHREQ